MSKKYIVTALNKSTSGIRRDQVFYPAVGGVKHSVTFPDMYNFFMRLV